MTRPRSLAPFRGGALPASNRNSDSRLRDAGDRRRRGAQPRRRRSGRARRGATRLHDRRALLARRSASGAVRVPLQRANAAASRRASARVLSLVDPLSEGLEPAGGRLSSISGNSTRSSWRTWSLSISPSAFRSPASGSKRTRGPRRDAGSRRDRSARGRPRGRWDRHAAKAGSITSSSTRKCTAPCSAPNSEAILAGTASAAVCSPQLQCHLEGAVVIPRELLQCLVPLHRRSLPRSYGLNTISARIARTARMVGLGHDPTQ